MSYEAIKTFEENTEGSDYVIGDIHGHYRKLRHQLVYMGFDVTRDRLFSVGDLVDRGPESEDVIHWLKKDWFHAVMGNHDDLALDVATDFPVDLYLYRLHGGQWLLDMSREERKVYGEALARLPIAICVNVPNNRKIGIVHAQVPGHDWSIFSDPSITLAQEHEVMWGRHKIREGDTRLVKNIDHVYVGHTIVDKPITLGNVTYIETGSWRHKTKPFHIVKIN